MRESSRGGNSGKKKGYGFSQLWSAEWPMVILAAMRKERIMVMCEQRAHRTGSDASPARNPFVQNVTPVGCAGLRNRH